jgi:hypothetical protein
MGNDINVAARNNLPPATRNALAQQQAKSKAQEAPKGWPGVKNPGEVKQALGSLYKSLDEKGGLAGNDRKFDANDLVPNAEAFIKEGSPDFHEEARQNALNQIDSRQDLSFAQKAIGKRVAKNPEQFNADKFGVRSKVETPENVAGTMASEAKDSGFENLPEEIPAESNEAPGSRDKATFGKWQTFRNDLKVLDNARQEALKANPDFKAPDYFSDGALSADEVKKLQAQFE